jgi:carbamate kinase
MADTIVASLDLVVTHCCQCGLIMVLPADYQKRRRQDHKLFYCLNGHSQGYFGQTREEKLQEELNQTKEKLQRKIQCCEIKAQAIKQAEARFNGMKGAYNKLKKKKEMEEGT